METPTRAFGKCLKNHAAGSGGHALDGCGEFILTPNSNSADLTTLTCEACGCHRSFHHQLPPPVDVERVDVIENPNPPPTPTMIPTPSRFVAVANSSGILNSPSPAPISSAYFPAPSHMFFAFNPAAACFPAPELVDRNRQSILTTGSNGVRKKRFRSKFSQEQKTKMQEFAGKIGWKMPKKEDATIVAFCNEIGVEKRIFKVWMHNHKNIDNVRDNNNNSDNHNQNQNHRDNGGNANGGVDGSSSSY